jgi:cephalosporin hydroxylase
VVLDSDHHRDHVYKELQLYSPLVSPGCYLVVEDTHFNGHPILTGFGPGPFEAVQDFLKDHADFAPDSRRERFLMTFNPGGYLKRLR